MQNYSQVFADTLAEFVSPIVPADQGDNGKGQVCVRALYKINTTMNANVGGIAKTGGQTQFNGVAVDAGLDKSDGTGADYLTDVDLGNGTREIRLAYTPYAPPPAGTPLPPADWVQPTPDWLDWPGPLTLKSDSSSGTPEPGPEPPPVTDYSEVLEALDELGATLATMQVQQQNDTAAIMAHDDANTEKGLQQIRDLVEDVEESLMKIAVLLLLRRPEDPAAASAERETLHAQIRDRRHTRRKLATVASGDPRRI